MTDLFNADRRAQVWEVLAELFVGKELQDYDYAALARTLRHCAYAPDELERILRDEVAPVWRHNLSPLAIPEMEGWPTEEVVTRIRQHIANQPHGVRKLLAIMRRRRALPELVIARWTRLRRMI
ncbi:MAG TPA: hypothetical protein VNE00_24010 [Paraburkholderia sp.]|jgi:hypothetical protein|nr:hypothetical protein [Paraburkholderia sp.]